MYIHNTLRVTLIGMILSLQAAHSSAAVSADEAAQLKGALTPMGAERAGNKEGTIPAWTGGLTTVPAGFVNGGRRQDPYASEKPSFSITAKNMDAYADKLTEGTKALLKKYPDTYRLDVYPTHRTAGAPAWVYDNTFKNATRAKLVSGSSGLVPQRAFGGVPFPIPKSGAEAMWNHQLRWRGAGWQWHLNIHMLTSNSKWIKLVAATNDHWMPYYDKKGSVDTFNGEYWLARSVNSGPPIRAGEGIAGRLNIDEDKTTAWVYLTGQRRVRKLPNACCDTPTPFSAGTSNFDETEGFQGRLDRYDWKLIGKREVFIPYNNNRIVELKKDSDLLGERHLNPDHVRWELHRVWVVEATLRAGQRHVMPKSVYYLDEDSWGVATADRWDAKGQLWRVPFTLHVAMPDVPATVILSFGVYDLLSGSVLVNGVVGEYAQQYKIMQDYPDGLFTGDSLAAESVR